MAAIRRTTVVFPRIVGVFTLKIRYLKPIREKVMTLWKVTRFNPGLGEPRVTWFQDGTAAVNYCESISDSVYQPDFVCQEFEVSGAELKDLIAKVHAYRKQLVAPSCFTEETSSLPQPVLQAAS